MLISFHQHHRSSKFFSHRNGKVENHIFGKFHEDRCNSRWATASQKAPSVRACVRPCVRHICSLCYSVILFSLKTFIVQGLRRRGGAVGWSFGFEGSTRGFESRIIHFSCSFFLLLERRMSDFQARIGRQEGYVNNSLVTRWLCAACDLLTQIDPFSFQGIKRPQFRHIQVSWHGTTDDNLFISAQRVTRARCRSPTQSSSSKTYRVVLKIGCTLRRICTLYICGVHYVEYAAYTWLNLKYRDSRNILVSGWNYSKVAWQQMKFSVLEREIDEIKNY